MGKEGKKDGWKEGERKLGNGKKRKRTEQEGEKEKGWKMKLNKMKRAKNRKKEGI